MQGSKSARNRVLAKLYARPGHLMRRCQQIHVAVFLKECEEYNLTPIQYSSLYVLRSIEGIDQAKLASYIAIDNSTMGNVLKRLERRGLVKRKASSVDRRLRVIYLTDKGRKLERQAYKAMEKVQRLLLEPLTEREKEIFKKCLVKIADHHNDKSRAPLSQTINAK